MTSEKNIIGENTRLCPLRASKNLALTKFSHEDEQNENEGEEKNKVESSSKNKCEEDSNSSSE